jgi:hypothetical protein
MTLDHILNQLNPEHIITFYLTASILRFQVTSSFEVNEPKFCMHLPLPSHVSHFTMSSIYYHHHYYLLTPWSRVLLEKLTGFAASQEIPRFYGTRKFITILTSARHLSLSIIIIINI